MKIALVKLESNSPYSQSKHYDKEDVPKLEKELDDAYERRTWANRMHVTDDGRVFIPGMSFANSLKESAKRLSIKVKGQRNKTYTKSFEAGVMVPGDMVLSTLAKDVKPEKLFVPSDGQPGGGKRVKKYFPLITSWSGEIAFHVFDDLITDDIFITVLENAGLLVGIGRFRPQNRGYYGRFVIKDVQWLQGKEAIAAASGDTRKKGRKA